MALLQIHGTTEQMAEQIASRALGKPAENSSPIVGPRVYLIGPMEWLLIDYSFNDVRRRLRHGDARAFVRLTDVSEAFISFRIRGAQACRVLPRDIATPLTHSSAGLGGYAKTRLGELEVILHCTGENAFDVHVDKKLADQLELWFAVQQSASLAAPALRH
jgi:heterotetrameric sarcosine oxidase gamma subunit